MIHVYLDDYRPCPKGFVLARNAEECKLLIDSESIDILSLDYDLGWNEPTGYEVVRHLVESARYPKKSICIPPARREECICIKCCRPMRRWK